MVERLESLGYPSLKEILIIYKKEYGNYYSFHVINIVYELPK
jgi:hypothetical protein